MGFSRYHSSLIGLILNLSTGTISPQYHVVYNDMFSSVHSSETTVPLVWHQLVMSQSARHQVTLDDDVSPWLADEWLTPNKRAVKDNDRRRRAVQMQHDHTQTVTRSQTIPIASMEREIDTEVQRVPTQIPSSRTSDTQTIRFSGNHQVTIDDSPAVNRLPREPPPASSLPVQKEQHFDTPVTTPTPVSNTPFGLSLRRSSRLRTSPTVFDPGPATQPASKWMDAKIAFMGSQVSNHWPDQQEAKLDSTRALLLEMDLERNPHFYQPTGLAAGKTTDPDTPDLRTTLSGDHSSEY